MKFTVAAVLALATGALAGYKNETVAYTTEVVTALTTYCPEATTLTHNGQTYTITEATTLTITNCPCTVTKPVTTSSVVVCHTCGYNSTTPAAPYTPSTKPAASTATGTGSVKPTAPPPAVTAGAGKTAALSGAGLAAVLGLAALL